MEKEILPGVYLTDYRKSQQTTTTKVLGSISSAQEQEILTIELKELELQIKKLIESNIQLQLAFQETDDRDYYEALEENKIVIERKKERVLLLREFLKIKDGNLEISKEENLTTTSLSNPTDNTSSNTNSTSSNIINDDEGLYL